MGGGWWVGGGVSISQTKGVGGCEDVKIQAGVQLEWASMWDLLKWGHAPIPSSTDLKNPSSLERPLLALLCPLSLARSLSLSFSPLSQSHPPPHLLKCPAGCFTKTLSPSSK